ncbi:F-box/kelch-repeat protein [Senna tora]|uniref:F-box/kelch-repeat protein n=1 Tax=Senna tora TaxID=362788 RepID=A0A834T124_9FABA|nr:F-box/kelch-repeat protein [Senna tora]
MEILPEDLIVEIFLRLPPKSLVRFRGFLFLNLNYGNQSVIWNPVTCVVQQIPPNPFWFGPIFYGFGYDAATDDYLIVLAIVSNEYNVSVRGIHVEIFSVRTNSWNKLNCNFPYIAPLDPHCSDEAAGSLLDGALHWLVFRLGRATIIAFDLTERNFRRVPMPDDIRNRTCYLKLKVLGGFLSLIAENDGYQHEIWVMREYGVKSSWARNITLCLPGFNPAFVSPICFTKDGEVIVVYRAGILVRCDDKGQVIEEFCLPDLHVFGAAKADASVYTESLFALPNGHGKIHTSKPFTSRDQLPHRQKQGSFFSALNLHSFILINTVTIMTYFAEELLLNIFLRLPVKSLLRFKSVSKLWHSLISDPHFANSHFQRSPFLSDRLLHIADSQVRSIDFHSSLSAVLHLNCPIIPPPPSLQIWGSCKGFVVVHNTDYFFVWNPSTGSYKQLTSFPMPSLSVPFIHGFGYDVSNDDYLLVLAARELRYAQFFSIKANSWKEIEGSTNFSYCNAVIESSIGSFLNGAIHWLVFGPHATTTDHVVLAFDVTERNFHEIPLGDNIKWIFGFSYFGIIGGCLGLCEFGAFTANIWLMKEYGVKSSWTKSFVVSLDNFTSPANYFCPIDLTQSGEIVGSDGITGYLRLNDKGEVLERRTYSNHWCKAVTYTETLLSLPCSNEEVGDSQH